MTTPTEKEIKGWWAEGDRIAKRVMREMNGTQMTRVTRWFFFTQPFRRWIVRYSDRLGTESRAYDWVLDRLYPIDADITFASDTEVTA